MPKIVDENIQPAGIPSFMSYSQISTPDLSAARGLQGVANLFEMGVGALDTLTEIQAKKETEQALTGLQDRIIGELEGGLRGVENAKQQGRISETEYWLKAHSIVKEAKSKYPGYTDVIDKTASRVMGVKPANVLQREYFRQQEEMAGSVDNTKAETFKLLKQAANKGVLDEQTIVNILKEDDPTKQMQYQGLLLALINQRGKVDYMKSKLELKSKLGELSREEVKTTANEIVSQQMSSFFTKTVLNAKTNYFELLEQVGADAKVTPEEQKQLVSTVNTLKSQFRSSLMQLLFTPDKNGKSMAQVLGVEEAKKIVDNAVKTFDEFIVKPVSQSGGDLSLLKANAKMWESLMLNNKMEALAYPTMKKIATLREIAGQEAVKFVFTRSPETFKRFMDESNKFITATEIADALGLDEEQAREPKSLSEALKSLSDKVEGSDRVVGSNVLIDTLYRTLTGKGVDPRAKRNAFMVFFNNKDENILSRIDPKDREAFFKRMTSTSVRKAVAELENEIPNAREQYARWVLGNAGVLYRDKLGMLQEWQQSGEITVNENGKIEWHYRGEQDKVRGTFNVDRLLPQVQQTVDEITKPLRLLGINPQKATQMLLEMNNVSTVPAATNPEFDIQRQTDVPTPQQRPAEQIQQQVKQREDAKQGLDEYQQRKGQIAQDINKLVSKAETTISPRSVADARKFASSFRGRSAVVKVGNQKIPFEFRNKGRVAVGYIGDMKLVIAAPGGKKLSPQFKTKYYAATLPVALKKSPLRDALSVMKKLGKNTLVTTSLYRDPEVNKDSGGAKGSQHRHGTAIDISGRNFRSLKERMAFVEEMYKRGYRRFGFYRSGAIHVDSLGKGGANITTWGSNFRRASTPRVWRNFMKYLKKKYG